MVLLAACDDGVSMGSVQTALLYEPYTVTGSGLGKRLSTGCDYIIADGGVLIAMSPKGMVITGNLHL